VAANYGNSKTIRAALACGLSNKGLGADNVERGDAEEALSVEDALGLEDFGCDGHGRIDGVGDDQDEGLGSHLGRGRDEIPDDSGVDVKEIVAAHAGLARNAGGNDDDVGIFERLLVTIVRAEEALDLSIARDVGQVGSDTGRVDDIVERELVDERGELQEKGQRLK
jgi:hypothetical protein